MSLSTEYEERYNTILTRLADPLNEWLVDILRGIPRIDRISTRAKSVERFLAKAEKVRDGKVVYEVPLAQIQDQLGVRVIVFYTNDVERVNAAVLKHFSPMEEAIKRPERDEEFGYFGKHFILPLPHDIIPKEIEPGNAPTCFELQIKTLYQHAWSEAEHDVGYKPSHDLASNERRALAFLAAQSWGADRVLDDLARVLIPDYAN